MALRYVRKSKIFTLCLKVNDTSPSLSNDSFRHRVNEQGDRSSLLTAGDLNLDVEPEADDEASPAHSQNISRHSDHHVSQLACTMLGKAYQYASVREHKPKFSQKLICSESHG